MNQKIIILEGADMTGKSHIAKELSTQLNIPVIKVKRIERWFDPLVDLLYGGETMTQFIQQSKISCILDRNYPSEYAYSKVYNRPTSIEKIKTIDARFSAMNTLIVICYKQEAAYQEDDQQLIDISKYNALNDAFREFANMSTCKILFLDTSNENVQEQINSIINSLE